VTAAGPLSFETVKEASIDLGFHFATGKKTAAILVFWRLILKLLIRKAEFGT